MYKDANGIIKDSFQAYLVDDANFTEIEEYVAHAVQFANTIDRRNNVSFIDIKGSTYKYNMHTHEFAIIDKRGYVITHYIPTDGINYYNSEKSKKGRKYVRKKKKIYTYNVSSMWKVLF